MKAMIVFVVALSLLSLAQGEEAASDAEVLKMQIDSLRIEGLYGEAVVIAKEFASVIEMDEDRAAYELADAMRLIATLEHIASLPEEARKELAEADRITDEFMILYEDDDLEGAIELAEKQVEIRKKHLGGEFVDVASSMYYLASFLEESGDYDPAVQIYRESLAINRKVRGRFHPDIAIESHNLASILMNMGEYDASEPLFRDAVAIYRELYGENDTDVASSLNGLAIVLSYKGMNVEAEACFKEALEIYDTILEEADPYVADTHTSYASLLHDKGDLAAAERHYKEGLEIYRTTLPENDYFIAVNLNNFADYYHDIGKYNEAESLYTEAIEMLDILEDEGDREAAIFRLNLARNYRDKGEYDTAGAIYPEATTLIRELFGKKHPWYSMGLFSYSNLYTAMGAYEEAGRLLLEQVPVYESARERIDPGLARRYFQNSPYAKLANAHLFNGKTKKAWPAAERELGRVLEELLFASQGEIDESLTEERALALKHVQRAISENTAIIGWLDVETKKGHYTSWGYVIRHEGPVAWEHIIVDEQISPYEQTRALRSALTLASSQAAGVRLEAKEVWSQRFAPLLDALVGVDNLVAIPSGAMLGIPLEALTGKDGTMLCERYAISYTPSATIYTLLGEQKQGRNSDGTGRSLLIGDPPFSSLPRLPATRDEVYAVAAITPSPTVLLGEEASEQRLFTLIEQGELQSYSTIHIATHGLMDNVRTDRSALALSQANLRDQSGAAISGEKVFDGLVTAGEIVREWKLDADLVTLSACETGLGKRITGEGYVGLSYAFLQAGARSLIVSLWKVEDRATRLLMERFYENCFGRYSDERLGKKGEPMTKAAALQEAKLWLRGYTDAKTNRSYASPYYWSAFILIGDRELLAL